MWQVPSGFWGVLGAVWPRCTHAENRVLPKKSTSGHNLGIHHPRKHYTMVVYARRVCCKPFWTLPAGSTVSHSRSPSEPRIGTYVLQWQSCKKGVAIICTRPRRILIHFNLKTMARAFLVFAMLKSVSLASHNAVGQLPVMGWSGYNAFMQVCIFNINQQERSKDKN